MVNNGRAIVQTSCQIGLTRLDLIIDVDRLRGRFGRFKRFGDDGKLWIGTSKGLAQMQDDGSFTVMTQADGLFSDNVFSMAEAQDGSLWIGSFGGVTRLYPES